MSARHGDYEPGKALEEIENRLDSILKNYGMETDEEECGSVQAELERLKVVRERYLGIAEKHLQLENILLGHTSFREELDSILDRIEEEGKRLIGKDQSCMQELDDYLGMLADCTTLSDGPAKKCSEYAEALFEHRKNELAATGGILAWGAGLAMVMIPPLYFLEGPIYMIGAMAAERLLKSYKKGKIARKNRGGAFWVIYLCADETDTMVGKAFALEHFSNNPHRFAQNYENFEPWYRQHLSEELWRRLEAGAIDMDEQELSDYLASLREE